MRSYNSIGLVLTLIGLTILVVVSSGGLLEGVNGSPLSLRDRVDEFGRRGEVEQNSNDDVDDAKDQEDANSDDTQDLDEAADDSDNVKESDMDKVEKAKADVQKLKEEQSQSTNTTEEGGDFWSIFSDENIGKMLTQALEDVVGTEEDSTESGKSTNATVAQGAVDNADNTSAAVPKSNNAPATQAKTNSAPAAVPKTNSVLPQNIEDTDNQDEEDNGENTDEVKNGNDNDDADNDRYMYDLHADPAYRDVQGDVSVEQIASNSPSMDKAKKAHDGLIPPPQTHRNIVDKIVPSNGALHGIIQGMKNATSAILHPAAETNEYGIVVTQNTQDVKKDSTVSPLTDAEFNSTVAKFTEAMHNQMPADGDDDKEEQSTCMNLILTHLKSNFSIVNTFYEKGEEAKDQPLDFCVLKDLTKDVSKDEAGTVISRRSGTKEAQSRLYRCIEWWREWLQVAKSDSYIATDNPSAAYASMLVDLCDIHSKPQIGHREDTLTFLKCYHRHTSKSFKEEGHDLVFSCTTFLNQGMHTRCGKVAEWTDADAKKHTRDQCTKHTFKSLTKCSATMKKCQGMPHASKKQKKESLPGYCQVLANSFRTCSYRFFDHLKQST
eukprot:Nk52_evm10s277 gene=Nk52_evmTU10s277